MRVAVVGSGISGLGAAIALRGMPGLDVVVFEHDARIGGHANTINVDYDGQPLAVDTGFIVYNELNYPNLTAMFSWAGVETIASDMSFALSSDDGAFEWAGRQTSTLRGLFAQRRNWFDPGFYRFILGIRVFQKLAISDVENNRIGSESLGDYLRLRGIPDCVRDDYVVPMGAAIWSMTPGETLGFPARAFMAFFNNHKLLQWDRPRWRTVKGGSRRYAEALKARLGDVLRPSNGISSVRRGADEVIITTEAGAQMHFDAVILATHAPTALRLLADATAAERDVLGAFRVSANRVVVHRDVTLMPHRRAAWASWNLLRRKGSDKVGVTYWMNALQSLPESCRFS